MSVDLTVPPQQVDHLQCSLKRQMSMHLSTVLALTALFMISVTVVDGEKMCHASGYCSLDEQPSHYIGPLRSNLQLRAALTALAYKKVVDGDWLLWLQSLWSVHDMWYHRCIIKADQWCVIKADQWDQMRDALCTSSNPALNRYPKITIYDVVNLRRSSSLQTTVLMRQHNFLQAFRRQAMVTSCCWLNWKRCASICPQCFNSLAVDGTQIQHWSTPLCQTCSSSSISTQSFGLEHALFAWGTM